jgi:hypothetical protein
VKSAKKILNPIAYSQKLTTSIAYSITNKLEKISSYEADQLIKSYSHLISDSKYKPFFYKKLYSIGKSAFITLATRAEAGKNPPALFVHLLKEYDRN